MIPEYAFFSRLEGFHRRSIAEFLGILSYIETWLDNNTDDCCLLIVFEEREWWSMEIIDTSRVKSSVVWHVDLCKDDAVFVPSDMRVIIAAFRDKARFDTNNPSLDSVLFLVGNDRFAVDYCSSVSPLEHVLSKTPQVSIETAD